MIGLASRTPRGPRIEPSRLSRRDLLSEAVSGMLQRPARSALTALGTVLGVGTFVAVLGLTATTSSQIDDRFSLLSATEVSVRDVGAQQDEFAGVSFPEDAERRIERLHGVEHAGLYWEVEGAASGGVSGSPVAGGTTEQVKVYAASPGMLDAAGASVAEGRLYDDFLAGSDTPVALLGEGLATRLGITTTATRPAVFIDGQAFTVVGILSDVRRKPELLLNVVVPPRTADRVWGVPKRGGTQMLIETRPGAARQIAHEAPVALDPAHPSYLKATPPPDPRSLRSSVTSDLSRLFLLLAAICLVIGAVGIANTTLVAVLERTGEIGLRRALGAGARHIMAQFLSESGALGVLGGLIGTSLGTVLVVVVSAWREWTPVVDPATVAAAPLVGLATGLLAGLYPAWRASRIQPAEALRR
ncbi:ABC transporter permease [Streptomyces sp. DT18]